MKDFATVWLSFLVIGSRRESIFDFSPRTVATVAAGLVFLAPVTHAQLTAEGNQGWALSNPDLVGEPARDDQFGKALAAGDFNCDSFDDLAIGIPYRDITGSANVGAVSIIYGTEQGLAAENNQILEGWDGIRYFGASLVAGNFNGDQIAGYDCDDLAIGAPEAYSSEGRVVIYHGAAAGLQNSNQIWSQGSSVYGPWKVPGTDALPADKFGFALASGDFDCDGFDDLAIGVPGESVENVIGENVAYAGSVNVIYGSDEGLDADTSSERDFVFSQNTDGVYGWAEKDDRFGSSLAAGNIVGSQQPSCYEDLAVGVPNEGSPLAVKGVNLDPEVGAVNIIPGSESGLDPQSGFSGGRTESGFLFEDPLSAFSLIGFPWPVDHFGYALAIGEFGEGEMTGVYEAHEVNELVIGVPGQNLVPVAISAGAVHIWNCTTRSYNPLGYCRGYITQNTDNVKGKAEYKDKFGSSLAVGDFDDDSYDDLAVGVPFEDIGNKSRWNIMNQGAVHVFYGDENGLTTRDEIWHQDDAGIWGTTEQGDHFGASLAVGDFNNDGADDLAIGVPQESVGPSPQITKAGAVNVLYGKSIRNSSGAGNRRPEAQPGTDMTIYVGENCEAIAELDGSNSFDLDNDPLTFTWFLGDESVDGASASMSLPMGVHEVVLRVEDGRGGSNQDSITVAVTETPPFITCPVDVVAEATSEHTTLVDIGQPKVEGSVCAGIEVTHDAPLSYPLGNTNVTWAVNTINPAYDPETGDMVTHEYRCIQTVEVVDTTPPTIERLFATPAVLWPPNKELQPILVVTEVSDIVDASPVCELSDIQVNQAVRDNKSAIHYEITGPDSALLLADREGSAGDRVYTLEVTCSDFSGNVTSGTTHVLVPHDKRAAKSTRGRH